MALALVGWLVVVGVRCLGWLVAGGRGGRERRSGELERTGLRARGQWLDMDTWCGVAMAHG